MRAVLASFVLLVSALLASVDARAENVVAARLDYVRSAGAERCPEAAAIEQSVSAQLGYAVFERAPVTRWVRVQISAMPRGLRAQLEVRGEGEVSLGARTIESPSTDCSELASALALAISLALDPMQMLAPKPVAPEAVAACPTCPVCLPVQASDVERAPFNTPPPPPPIEPPSFRGYGIALGSALGIHALPKVSGAAQLEVLARWRHLSVHAGGVLHPGASVEGIEAQLLLGQLAACARMFGDERVAASLCAAGSLGALRGYHAASDHRETSIAAALGGQARVRAELAAPVFVEGRAELEASLVSTTLRVGSAPVWDSPPYWVLLGLAVGVHFP